MCPIENNLEKQAIMTALTRFAEGRPGIDPRNYGDCASYNQERASVYRDLRHARELLRKVELRASITADDLLVAAKNAFGGRLSLVRGPLGDYGVDYCIGQSFAIEFRRAVCAVCASALWARKRDDLGTGIENLGHVIRGQFSREFKRGIASRYFS